MEIKALVANSSNKERKNITRSLKEIGVANVVEATDGNQAMELLQTGKFDVFFAEYNAKINNEELVKTVRTINGQLPIIVTGPKSKKMDELKKVKRVMGRVDATAPHEVLLVLDASQGQNALQQARLFNEALGVTGIVLTKLDGTAKGGIVFAIASELALPIRYIGIGESAEDFAEFDAEAFVDTLLRRDN